MRTAAGALDALPGAPREVVLVSRDEARLAAAGAAGINRLVATEPEATAAALRELCRELDRP